jgi:hypothetical protein
MRERDFQAWLLDVAQTLGWRAWHVPMPSRQVGGGRIVPTKEGAGLPDLVLLHDDPPVLILAELKGTGGQLRPEQREFLRLARAVVDAIYPPGPLAHTRLIGVYSWRPGMEDAIEAVLSKRML